MITRQQLRNALKSIGYGLRIDNNEFEVRRLGALNSNASYFTNDPDDALGTAIVMCISSTDTTAEEKRRALAMREQRRTAQIIHRWVEQSQSTACGVRRKQQNTPLVTTSKDAEYMVNCSACLRVK